MVGLDAVPRDAFGDLRGGDVLDGIDTPLLSRSAVYLGGGCALGLDRVRAGVFVPAI